MSSAKSTKWKPIETEELFNYFGIYHQMGIEKRPKLSDSWSVRNMFNPSFAANLMSRNRFTQTLRCLRFVESERDGGTNKLYKIQPILDVLNESFLKVCKPGKDVTIDESVVPFRGRVFRQYIREKRQRFGIELFKIDSKGGYTFKLEVYAGTQGS
ncbi:unnamed protein product [Nippostrongylus brasiliensis]|uniref:PiggyBac transposable element-derived protein 4 (inferred by orthology to a human protein) n=1 Tax=Nippostrongylus brasiliensis TaxID=27835 RepID=A0A0N4XN57_NIPBR|nr:unnamed protein product [Nippostrongylus brasiliensis]